MHTNDLDTLTKDFARMNEAGAFVVAALARHTLGGLEQERDVLDTFLTQRKSIPRALHALVTKAAVAAMDLSSGLGAASPLAAAFLGQVQRVSPLGQIGGITIHGNITGAVQATDATATWAGEQVSKPVTSLTFSAAGLRPLKLVAQIVVSDELANLSLPSALPIVQRALVSAAAAAEATALFDPASTAIANVRPASLTAGLVPIVAAGDFANNVGQVLNGISGGDPTAPVLVMSLGSALRLRTLADLASLGVRVVISSAAGSTIIGIDADGLLVTEGGIEIRTGHPDLQMSDAPDSPPTAATVLTSTWQKNLTAVKVERWVAWTVRPGAAATLTLA